MNSCDGSSINKQNLKTCLIFYPYQHVIVRNGFDLSPTRQGEIELENRTSLSGCLVFLYPVTHDAPDFSTLPHRCCAAVHHRVGDNGCGEVHGIYAPKVP